MKQNEVFNKIGGIIKELSDQYEYLQTVKDNLNDLELDLFAANAQFLTDHVEILCKLNLQNPKFKKLGFEKTESTAKEKFFEPVVQQMKNGNRLKESKTPAETEIPIAVENIKTETPEEQPVPQIDLSSNSGDDNFSYIRESSVPVREDLVINEAQEPVQETIPDFEEIRLSTKTEKEETSEPVDQPEPPITGPGRQSEPEIATPISFVIEAPIEPQPDAVIPEEPFTEAPLEKGPEAIESNKAVEEPVADQQEEATEALKEQTETVVEKAPQLMKPYEPAVHKPALKVSSEKKAADKAPEEEKLTINQLFSQMADKPASKFEQLNIKPISDIKLAITLNDKLLYVKDLFNGYNLAYSEAVEILNRFNTFEEAMRFLNTNYVTKNNWDAKPVTTEKFYALLKRRYA